MLPTAAPDVPLAVPGPIHDHLLKQAIDCADRAVAGDLSALEAEFLLWVAAPLLRELALRRQRMTMIAHIAVQAGNVVPFEGGRA